MNLEKPGMFSAIGAFSLSLAIVLGAWNAHGMEKYVKDGLMNVKYIKTFHTGVEYMFISSLGLLILGLVRKNNWLNLGMWCIFTGMILFSFSLFILSFNQMLGDEFRKLGMIAPIGGMLMACGWIFTAISFFKKY
jgi:uncharacterized membrane protein YgdD (TMEM256/DUF423 family)